MTESSSDLIDKLAQEFLAQLRAGESPSVSELADRYPELADQIRAVFPTLGTLEGLKPTTEDDVQLGGKREGEQSTSFPTIPDYRIFQEIGRGGMGVVYEAEHLALGRRVALKVLPSNLKSDPTAVQRFQQEARAAAAMHHSNIVPVFDVGSTDEYNYYAMQLIVGDGLDCVIEVLREMRDNEIGSAEPEASGMAMVPHQVAMALTGEWSSAAPADDDQLTAQSPLPGPPQQGAGAPAQGELDTPTRTSATTSNISALNGASTYARNVARIGVEVADALEHAHRRGFIHRDIKPSNILLDTEGSAWVADFGLAKAENIELTQTGNILGTLRYMSPERFSGPCGRRGDVYGIGATLYEMLALQPIFCNEDHLSLVDSIKNETPTSLRELNAKVPKDLETIVNKAIEKEPARRYSTASLLSDDLQRFMDGRPIRARRVSTRERLWIWAKRNPVVSSLATLLLLTVLGTLIGSIAAALVFRNMAVEQTALTNTSNRLLRERERDLYFSHMQQAYEASKTPSGRKLLRSLLEKAIPSDEGADHRDWEWYWLHSIAENASVVVRHPDMPNWTVSWSPTEDYVCWGNGNVLCVADWPDLSTLKAWEASESETMVFNARFSPDEKLLAVARLENKVRIWDWRNEELVRTLEFDESLHAEAICWSPTGDMLVVQTENFEWERDGKLYVYDTTDWKTITTIDNAIRDFHRQIAFSPDGTLLAVGVTGRPNSTSKRRFKKYHPH